jgi:tRNA U55 pseudouridine synthase TruB
VKISEMLGTCGMVSRLLRSFGSGISVDQAHSLAEVVNSWDRFEDFVIPMSDIKLNLPVWQVKDSETVKRLLCGQRLLIDQKCFRQSLEFQEDYSDNEVDKFLLRNETGDAFGIGSSLLGSDGQVTAFLHRGL